MSLYSDYLRETNLKNIVEHEWGFATYSIIRDECYIEDIYIVPTQRKSKSASGLAQEIEAKAKAAGCKYLTGSVNTKIKDPTTSIRVLLGYGFKFLKAEPHALWFAKEML